MTSRTALHSLGLIAIVLGLPTTAAVAQSGENTAESIYLSLAQGNCDTVEVFEYGMGAVVDCGSAAGYTVHLVDYDLRQRLVLIDNGQEIDVDPDVLNFSWLGPMLEFRGHRTASGFDPYAVIVRVHLDDGTGTGREVQRLLVTALDDGQSCELGWIDAAGNPDHNQDARSLADTARQEGCPAGVEQGTSAKS